MENTNAGTTIKRVEEYSLADFAKRVQNNIKEGYELDLDTNENYPQQFGTLFTCGMVAVKQGGTFTNKEGKTVVVGECGGPEIEVTPTPVKRGRKPTAYGQPLQ